MSIEKYLNKVHNIDCLDFMKKLPDKCVDLVLTDPPYGIGKASGTIGKNRSHKTNYTSFCDSKKYVKSLCVPAIKECLRIAHRVILTPGPICLTYYPAPDSFGVINQPATCGMSKWGRADAQPIFYYGRDPRVGKTIQFCSYTNTERPSCKSHPCSKPISLWQKLLKRGSDSPSDIIFDPFMGSGTTAVAAYQLGRRWLGCEISKEYCEIANKRIAEEMNNLFETVER